MLRKNNKSNPIISSFELDSLVFEFNEIRKAIDEEISKKTLGDRFALLDQLSLKEIISLGLGAGFSFSVINIASQVSIQALNTFIASGDGIPAATLILLWLGVTASVPAFITHKTDFYNQSLESFSDYNKLKDFIARMSELTHTKFAFTLSMTVNEFFSRTETLIHDLVEQQKPIEKEQERLAALNDDLRKLGFFRQAQNDNDAEMSNKYTKHRPYSPAKKA